MLRKLASASSAHTGERRATYGALAHTARFLKCHVLPTLMALGLVGLATLVYFGIAAIGFLNFIPVIYLVPVVIAATRWGALPAIAASVGGFLASDYFFYSPYYSFAMDDPQEVVDLLLFLAVALVTSNLAMHLKREADALRRKRKEIHDLYDFSRRLASCFTVSDLVLAIQIYVSRTLERTAFLFNALSDGDRGSFDVVLAPEQVQQEARAMIAANTLEPRTIVDPLTRSTWLLTPLSSETAYHGVIAVDLGGRSRTSLETMRRQVDAILGDAAITLERLDLVNAMNEAKLRRESEILKEALVGSVSHELRTPLTAIVGSASVLEQSQLVQDNAQIRTLVAAIHDEAKRLDNEIQNLISATRISARDMRPRLDWVDPADIVNAAVKQRSPRLSEHRVVLNLDRDLPLLNVESALIEQAFGQLLENAAKYSPSGSVITVTARTESDRVVLSVRDDGVGLLPDETPNLGQRAFRGHRHLDSVPGSGLGLWIATTFVAVNGGTIDAVSQGPGLGTTVSIRLPAAEQDMSALMMAAE